MTRLRETDLVRVESPPPLIGVYTICLYRMFNSASTATRGMENLTVEDRTAETPRYILRSKYVLANADKAVPSAIFHH